MSLRSLRRLKASPDKSLEEVRRLKKLASELNDGWDELAALGEEAASVHHRTLACVLLQGKRLNEVKETVAHGKFMPWVATHTRIPHRTAVRWMAAACWAEDKLAIVANLQSVGELYLLAGIIPAPEQPELRTEPTFNLAVAIRWLRPVARLNVAQALALSSEERCVLLTALEPAHAAYEALRGSVVPDVEAHTDTHRSGQ